MKLGQILMHRRIIARDQLREALRRQRRTGEPIGQILMRMGIVSRADIVEALMTQPRASVDVHTLEETDPRIVAALPLEFCEELCCIALMLTEGALVVALADPMDRVAIEALEDATGLEVVAMAADPIEIVRVAREKLAEFNDLHHADGPAAAQAS